MQLFVYLFPPGLVLLLSVAFVVTGMGSGAWSAMWAVAPWLIISPWVASKMESRTTRAVDALVRSLTRL